MVRVRRSRPLPTRVVYSAGVKGLRDIVCPNPRVLLVGINPSLRSAEVGHHFASPGNPFWRLLHAAAITPQLLTAVDDRRLAEAGIALTNLCPRPTRAASELTRAEFEAGRRALARKCARLKPDVVAFIGISLYPLYFGLAKSGGPGPKPETIAGAAVFAVPNPSGLNASFPGFASKLIWFEQLAAFVADRAA
jgi:TDG/mug DNA glycosylase family protein